MEQYKQFKRFHQQHLLMVNNTSLFKTGLIGKNAEASRVNHNTLRCLTFSRSRQQTSRYKSLLGQSWAEELAL